MATKSLILALSTEASNYAKGMKLAKDETANAKKELALWAEQNNKSTTAVSYLSKELKSNKEQYAVLGKQIDLTKSKIAELSKDYDKNASSILSYKNKLLDLETAQAKVNNTMKAAPAAMLKSTGSSLTSVGGKLTAGVTAPIVAASAAAGAALWASTENADKVQRTADVTGLSAERIQELGYIAAKVDSDLETLVAAQTKLTRGMYQAVKGTEGQSNAFKFLKIDVVDSNGAMRDSKVVMLETFDALNKVKNETERDALSLQLFGRSALELNPLIKTSSEELKQLALEAHSTGSVMSNAKIEALDSFSDSLEAMKWTAMSTAGEFAVALLPAVNGAMKSIQGAVPYVKKLADEFAKMPDSQRNATLGLIGFAAVIGPALSSIGFMSIGLSNLIAVAPKILSAFQFMGAGVVQVFSSISYGMQVAAAGAGTFAEGFMLSMGPGGWAMLGITAISALTIGLISYNSTQQRTAQQNIQSATTAATEIAQIRNLEVKYYALKTATSLTTEGKSDLKSIQDQLIQSMPSLKGVIDNETVSWNNQKSAIDGIISSKAKLLEAGAISANMTLPDLLIKQKDKNNTIAFLKSMLGKGYNSKQIFDKAYAEKVYDTGLDALALYFGNVDKEINRALAKKLKESASIDAQVKEAQDAQKNYDDFKNNVNAPSAGGGGGGAGGGGGDASYAAEAAAARKKAEAEAAAAKAEAKRLAALQALATAFESYKSKLDGAIESTMKFVGMFDKFEIKSVSLGSMIRNMQKNLSTMKDYYTNMKLLESRGLSQGVIADLYSRGVSAAGEVKRLVGASDANIATINSTYADQQYYANQIGFSKVGGQNGITQYIANINGETLDSNALVQQIFDLLSSHGIKLNTA